MAKAIKEMRGRLYVTPVAGVLSVLLGMAIGSCADPDFKEPPPTDPNAVTTTDYSADAGGQANGSGTETGGNGQGAGSDGGNGAGSAGGNGTASAAANGGDTAGGNDEQDEIDPRKACNDGGHYYDEYIGDAPSCVTQVKLATSVQCNQSSLDAFFATQAEDVKEAYELTKSLGRFSAGTFDQCIHCPQGHAHAACLHATTGVPPEENVLKVFLLQGDGGETRIEIPLRYGTGS